MSWTSDSARPKGIALTRLEIRALSTFAVWWYSSLSTKSGEVWKLEGKVKLKLGNVGYSIGGDLLSTIMRRIESFEIALLARRASLLLSKRLLFSTASTVLKYPEMIPSSK